MTTKTVRLSQNTSAQRNGMRGQMQLSGLSDEDLMAKYQLGSEEAFAVLYTRHSSKVFSFVRKRVFDQEKASEIFQEVFVKMHRSKHLYNRTLPYLPWLFSISKSVVLDSMRSESRRIQELKGQDLDAIAPEEKAIENLFEIEPHLALLPTSQKHALELRYLDEQTFEEIAEVLKTSPINARKLISRGLKRLKELIVEGESHERQK